MAVNHALVDTFFSVAKQYPTPFATFDGVADDLARLSAEITENGMSPTLVSEYHGTVMAAHDTALGAQVSASYMAATGTSPVTPISIGSFDADNLRSAAHQAATGVFELSRAVDNLTFLRSNPDRISERGTEAFLNMLMRATEALDNAAEAGMRGG